MSKTIIPKDHQKYCQREFPLGCRQILVQLKVEYISNDAGNLALPDIYALTLGHCSYNYIRYAICTCLCYNLYSEMHTIT